eukprot:Gregarina_sp_Pseudo_9__1076@NODE_16_length_6292_cov_28_020310_g14_i0_p6_GENE_NODE_16_length_6292_cov_28_020310_g14_i0NODE_16_length_6292_cov_28_020310_g14_i0_p6_ORF_typecomplete_len310_score58_23UPF0121/PF03661_13/4_4e25FtsX/PF02687_21/22FtsX/PF02687_21/6_1_NODE_16_length_6292_cov_28_020310_g14_i050625991
MVTKFEEFDWVNNKQWHAYLESLFPTPPNNKIQYFKKKWYKKEIDPSFDITTDETSQETASSAGASSAGASASQVRPPAASSTRMPSTAVNSLQRIATVLFCGAVVLSLGSFVPSSLASRLRLAALSLFLFGSCAHICGTLGLPKFQAAYWEGVFYSEPGQAIMMTFLALVIGSQVSLAMLSPMMSGLMLASEGLVKLNLPPTIRHYAQLIQNNKYMLMQTQSDIEVFLGIFIFFLGLFGRVNFLPGLVYWNILRTKYAVNGFTKSTFGKFDGKIRSVLSHPMAPRIVFTIYDKVAHAMKRFADPAQPQ